MNKITQIKLSPDDGFKGFGSLGLENEIPEDAGGVFNNLVSTIIGLMTVVAFVWFVFLLIAGAISMMGAGGDKAKLETAKQKLTTGIIGVIVVIAAVFVVDLIGNLFGIPDILNPAELIKTISQ